MRQTMFGLFLVFSVAGTMILMVVVRQPDVLHVERSTVIKGVTADDVYPLAADLEAYKTWDPWSKKDPNQQTTFSAETAGVGAWMAWEGNDEVGKGKMTVAEVVPGEKVVSDLAFLEPFEANATSTLTIAPHDKGVHVTWAMDQPQDFGGKFFATFVDMDGMLGPDFESGLRDLGAKAKEVAKTRIAEEEALEEADRLRREMAAAQAEGAAE